MTTQVNKDVPQIISIAKRIDISDKSVGTSLHKAKRTGKLWETQVQIAAMNAALHAHVHGNITAVNDLVNQLPKGARSNTLKAWFETHAPVVWQKVIVEGKETKDERFFYMSEKAKDIVLNGDKGKVSPACPVAVAMSSDNWGSHKTEPEYKPVSFWAMMESTLKKLEGAAAKNNELDDIDTGDLQEMRAQFELLKLSHEKAKKSAKVETTSDVQEVVAALLQGEAVPANIKNQAH